MFVGHKIILVARKKKTNRQSKAGHFVQYYLTIWLPLYIAIKFDGACDISKVSIQVARVKEVNYNENGA